MYNYQTGAFKTVGFNDENGKPMGDTLKVSTTGMQRIEYLPEFYLSYDKTDSRRDATFLGPIHVKTIHWQVQCTKNNGTLR